MNQLNDENGLQKIDSSVWEKLCLEQQMKEKEWCDCGTKCPTCGKKLKPWSTPSVPYTPPYYPAYPYSPYPIWVVSTRSQTY
jgi:hypothetical protein